MTKSALISGASRGIGLGIANQLAQQGYSLTSTARDADRLDAVAVDLRARGAAEVIPVAADMSDEEGVARVLTAHTDRHAAMSALVLNAGVGTAGTLAESSMRRFDKTIAVNVRAPFRHIKRRRPTRSNEPCG